MGTRTLRQRCEARLRNVDVPDPFDIDVFRDQLARRRGRALHVLPLPEGLGSNAPCGMWMATDQEDWIFVEPQTSQLHREHIVLHEISHMICGHVDELPVESFARLLPNLDVGMVTQVLGRTSYTTDEEREAELLASLILARARRPQRPRSSSVAPDVAEVLDRTARTLGSHE